MAKSSSTSEQSTYQPIVQIILKYALFAALATVISGLHYCFSPLLELCEHPDPGCFYMIGKAWANGIMPYVDVIDIKGPLLFAFFAIGYTIHGTLGVYLLLTLCLFATIIGVYRTIRLYTTSDVYALLAILLFLMYYLADSRSDGRSEDIILPTLVWSSYACLNCIAHRASLRRYLASACVLGVSTATITLIKYNAVLPLVCCAAYMVFYAAKNQYSKKDIARFVFVGFISYLAVIVPVAVFLSIKGALLPCIDVYFNVLRASRQNGSVSTMFAACTLLSRLFFPMALLLGMWLLHLAGKHHEKIWTTAFWVAYSIGAFLACIKGFSYYYIISVPVVIYACIGAVSVLPSPRREAPSRLPLAVAAGLFVAVIAPDVIVQLQRIQNPEQFRNPVDEEICKVPNARLLYLQLLDQGFGAGCDALPACRYWMQLNGNVFSSQEEQWQCVQNRIPDFVITNASAHLDEQVQACGYSDALEGKAQHSSLRLWKRK